MFLLSLSLALAQEPQGIVVTKGDTKITIGAALRFRAETRDPSPAVEGAGSKTESLGRFRANFDYQLNEKAQAFLQLQETVSPDGVPSSDTLHQAYGKLKGIADLADLQVGRFEMVYGGELMISNTDWSKTGGAFDGFRLGHTAESFTVDFFATQPVEGQAVPIGLDQSFMGLYGSMNPGAVVIDGYVLARDDRSDGGAGTDDMTIGGRFVWATKDGPALKAEAAMQTGDHGSTDATGIMLYGDASMRAFGKMQFGLNVLYASGDGDSTDTDDDAFKPLYNAAHKVLGSSDLFFLSNVLDVQPYATYSASNGWRLTGQVHILTLADEDGAIPDLKGGLVKAPGESDLGMQVEAIAWKTIFEEIDLNFGVSQYIVGDAVANGDDQLWAYVQVQFNI